MPETRTMIPSLIVRARESQGYSVADVAGFLMMPTERLVDLEAGVAQAHEQELLNLETLLGVRFPVRL